MRARTSPGFGVLKALALKRVGCVLPMGGTVVPLDRLWPALGLEVVLGQGPTAI